MFYYLQNNTSLISELKGIYFPVLIKYLRFTEFPSQNNNIFIYIEISGPLKTQEKGFELLFFSLFHYFLRHNHFYFMQYVPEKSLCNFEGWKNAKRNSQEALPDMSLKLFILNKVYQQERLWPYIKSRRNKGFDFVYILILWQLINILTASSKYSIRPCTKLF